MRIDFQNNESHGTFMAEAKKTIVKGKVRKQYIGKGTFFQNQVLVNS
jgi:hypothetical protein